MTIHSYISRILDKEYGASPKYWRDFEELLLYSTLCRVLGLFLSSTGQR